MTIESKPRVPLTDEEMEKIARTFCDRLEVNPDHLIEDIPTWQHLINLCKASKTLKEIEECLKGK